MASTNNLNRWQIAQQNQDKVSTVLKGLGLTGALSFGALGLSKAIGDAIVNKNPEIAVDKITNTIDNPSGIISDGGQYFSDMLKNLIDSF